MPPVRAADLGKLHVEMSPIMDALDDLQQAHRNLARKHGDHYRQLERDIETICEKDLSRFPIESLGNGTMTVGSPVEIVNLLRRARDLGVLPA